MTIKCNIHFDFEAKQKLSGPSFETGPFKILFHKNLHSLFKIVHVSRTKKIPHTPTKILNHSIFMVAYVQDNMSMRCIPP